jgi:hypothetical protein
LESLTPGGSEFVGSPDRCVEFVRARLSTLGKVAAERNDLRDDLLKTDEDRAHWMAKCAGLEVENARLKDFAAGRGMVSEADSVEEAAVLVCGLHGRVDKLEVENARLMRALDDIAGVAYNYDGYDSAGDLKKLIDELYVAARRALDGKEGFDVMEDKDV